MMDVSLTQVNGRKFSPAFKCIAFPVLSKTKQNKIHTHKHILSKNISEAFGTESTELWPLMESEALTGGFTGENPSLFLFDSSAVTQEGSSPPPLRFFETRVSDFTEFCPLALIVTFLFSIKGEEKLSTVYRVN